MTRPPAPDPTPAALCQWGPCGALSAGWRWSGGLRQWVRVCNPHRGSHGAVRRGDFVPDTIRKAP
ncbi:hypothetical protein ACIBG7_43120 [Nonomuraea sp. NPDC050328]|uniref:hypothetical protein n=1 Tax=Nonomuraea sp. NPDC050328 TaxID=3364361 RepID=UPI003799B142